MPRVGFRALAEGDLALLYTWLARPHVRRGYAPAPASFEEFRAKYGPRTRPGGPVAAFVIEVDGADAGYVQRYALDDFPDWRALAGVGEEAGLAGIDLLLGDEWRTGRGLGPLVIRRFVADHVFADARVAACIAGAHEGDAAALRAFEKAGFRRWKAACNERGEPQCLLRRDRDTGAYRIAPVELARDAQACARLRREMYLASFGTAEGLEEEMGPGDARYLAQLAERIAAWPEGNVHLWRDGEIVGQLEMHPLADEPGVAYVSLVHVAERWRGHGLGRRLLEHATAVARARGCRRMRLSVARRNAAAIAFYRALGWSIAGARPHRVPMALMERALG